MTERPDDPRPHRRAPPLLEPLVLAPDTPPCTCPRAVLARALDAVLDLGPGELEAVMLMAELRRPGVRAALAAAFEAEAAYLAAFSHRAYAAADRLTPDAAASAGSPT